jgi:hypothetical protein
VVLILIPKIMHNLYYLYSEFFFVCFFGVVLRVELNCLWECAKVAKTVISLLSYMVRSSNHSVLFLFVLFCL